MASNIKFKRSAVQNRVPTTAQLELGELALNTYDGKLYTEINTGSAAVVEIGSKLSSLVVDGANGGGNGDVTLHGTTAGKDLLWDYSANQLVFANDTEIKFGVNASNTDRPLFIKYQSSNTRNQVTGKYIDFNVADARFKDIDNGNHIAKFWQSKVVLCDGNGNDRLETTSGGVDIFGTGALKVPVGTTAQRQGSATAGDIRYNSTLAAFEGYTNGWGELGGGGIGIGSTSVNPGSGVVGHIVGVGYTTINFVGAGLSVTGYGSTVVVDIGNAVSRKYGRKIHSYTATNNQTTFTGLSYTDGASQVSVYLNGAKLSAATYTATSGNTVVLGTGASVDDEVEILVLDSGVDITRTVHSFTATAGQTAFTGLGYERGENLDVYLNGIRLAQSDYTATNGTSITLAVGASVGDILEIVDMGPGAQWESGFGEDNDDIFRFNGGVGIGTTNPTDKLNIVGNVEILGILTATTFSGVDTDKIEEGNTSVETVDTGSDGYIKFITEGTEKARIRTDGNMGIGFNATNPQYQLMLQDTLNTAYSASGTNAVLSVGNVNSGAATNSSGIHMYSDGNGRGVVNLNCLNNSSNASADFSIQTRHGGTLAERFRITSNGKVGIAQASPDYELDVTGSIGLTGAIRGASGSQGAPAYSFDGDSDTGMWRGGLNTLSFATGGIQRVYINNTTTTVSNNLTVTGNLQVDGTNTVVNSTTMTVDDKNIVLGSGAANDAAADGGGITLESGNGNKTFNWVDSTDAWTSSEHIHLGDDKQLLLGTSSDFKIYHSNALGNVIAAPQGHTTKFYGPQVEMYSLDGTKKSFVSDADASVELYHNNAKKIETTSSGVIVTGGVTADGFTLGDNEIIQFGASNDLKIFHNGSHSYIADLGTGDLRITGSAVHIQNAAQSENMLKCFQDGQVELYYDNTKRFETTNTGISITGNISLPSGNLYAGDGRKLMIGTSDDLQLFHNGTDSFIHNATGDLVIKADSFKVRNGAESEKLLDAYANGAVNLYHNDSKKLETTSAGVSVTGDIWLSSGNINLADSTGGSNNRIKLGTGDDLQVYHDGSNGYLYNSGSGTLILQGNGSNNVNLRAKSGENAIILVPDGAVELYHDGTRKAYTNSGGFALDSHLIMGDDDIIKLGNGADVQIYHNGSENRVWTANGSLDIRTTTANNVEILANDKYAVWCESDGMTALYHNGTRKIQTHFNGALIKAAGSSACEVHVQADNGDDNNDKWKLYANTDGTFGIASYASGDAWKKGILCTGQGKTQLYHNDTSRLETSSTGIWVNGTIGAEGLAFGDNKKLILGAQLEIYHDGTNSFINSKVNNLRIQRNGSDHIQLESDGDVWIKGSVYPWTNNTYTLGGSSYQWLRLYTSEVSVGNHTLAKHNDHNLIVRNNTTSGSSGICAESSNGTFNYQIYGNGGAYGFLDGKWANWDLQKTVGGQLAIDVGGTMYTVYHAGNSSSLSGGVHSNAMSKMTSSGTWSRPSGCTLIKVTVTAGGGGGGSHNADDAHGGGGAGGTSIKWIDVTSISSVSVTVGSGGGGGAGNQQSSGNGGGSSSFGSHCSASGGGHPTTWGRGGGGGGASGGDLNLQGGGGGSGNIDGQGNEEAGGTGGASFWGGGQSGGTAWGQRHSGGTYGTGGAGSHAGTDNDGADGNGGIVVIEHFY